MSNINVRVVGTANVTQMSGAFGKLEAQVTALNAQLAQMVALQNGVDPTGYERMSRAAAQNSKVFRNAAASTGMFEVQQLKVNKATDEYIKKLNKQQLSFRELYKQRKIASAAYKDQLAMENMMIRKNQSSISHGKHLLDVTYPKEISKDLDTASKRLSFFNQQLKSGAHQMVNWGKNTQWAGRQLMVGFTMPMAAFGAAAGVMAYQIDKELTRVAKVYDTTADANATTIEGQMALEKELMELREAGVETAIKAAREYGAAGKDTLQVQAELAATGMRGLALQQSTAEVMRISRLGEIEHQDAIAATIALQSVFRMSTDELTESFNYMNSVENATSLATQDFAAAIPIAAAPVKQFGGDIQELGILLTAMKERGIEATQGANAIKAAMQRLGRPSAQVQEEWQALTGTDITKLFDQSTSLIDLFQRISEATANLAPKDQIKAFAGLFGTYQVTRMSALVEGMRDLENGVGQVSTAMELAQGSAKDWADTADREMKRYRESISGQFDTALREFQMQLSTLGKPFVQVATMVLEALNKIISFFNGLPNAVKIGVAAMLGLFAVAGPVIMLTGLFANLMGQGIKTFATIGGWITKFTGQLKLATTEEKAAAMAAELHTAEMTEEASATQLLTMQLNKWTAAQQAANRASMQARATDLRATGMSSGLAYATAFGEDLRANGQANYMATFGTTSDEIAKNSEKTKTNWKGIGIHAGVAATAASMMLMSSEGMVGNIAEIVFYASLLGPMLLPLGGLISKGFAGAVAMGGKLKDSVVRAGAGAKGFAANVKSSATPMRTLATGAKSAAGSFIRMVGPANLIGAALIAGGFALYKWYDWQKKIAEEERAQEKAIVSRTNLLAESLDIQIKKQKELNALEASRPAGSTEATAFELADQLKDSESGQDLLAAYEEGNDINKQTIAMQKYVQVLESAGGTAEKARRYLEALFIASGDGALEAQQKAMQLSMALGDSIEEVEQTDIWSRLVSSNIGTDNLEEAEIQGESLGKALADGMARAAQGPNRKAVFDQFSGAIDQSFDELFNSLDERTIQLFNNMGINSGTEIRDAIANFKRLAEGELSPEEYGEIYNISGPLEESKKYHDLSNAVLSAQALIGDNLNSLTITEAEIVRTLAQQLGIKEDIATFTELQATKEYQLQTATKGQAMAAYAAKTNAIDMMRATLGALAPSEAIANQMKLMELNQWRVALGMRETGNLADGFGRATVDINGNIIEHGRNIEENNSKLRTQVGLAQQVAAAFRSLNAQDFLSSYQAGMAGVQQDMANDMRDAFDNRMNAALDARQDYWDNRSEQMSRKHEAAQKAMDNRWEARIERAEEYWDRRVELVDKAIEAEEKAEEKRQRMFDAEIARINKLNEMANTNIDFNVALTEGNFDEAAKIRNDIQASDASSVLERAAAAGSGRSARRIEKLTSRRDAIEKSREEHLESLQDKAEAEKAHLEKVQAMREQALQEETEADMEATREIWENRKESLEKQLDLFLSFIAANEKELKKHMDNVGLSYEKFGKNVLKPKGEEWSEYFGERMQFHIRKSGLELASDRMWETLGKDSVNGLLKGMGFSNMNEFRHFIQTGEFKNMGGGGRGGRRGGSSGADGTSDSTPRGFGETRHEGGFVGDGSGSRKGVARGLRGLHPNEKLVRAQKGEFVVNRRDAQANKDVLEAINSGQNTGFDHYENKPVGGAGSPGIAGLLAGALNRVMAKGIGTAMSSAYSKKMNEIKTVGRLGAIKPGMYGDRFFNASQLNNAKVIASVGRSMGMSERDIMIGIMTAITESGLVNVNYGDRDSLGLFQQRPSMGWGTPQQVTNPRYAAGKFFSSLKGVTDRGAMPPWLAAQAVQRSAFESGSNYRIYWDEAQAIWKAMEASAGRGGSRMYAAGPGGWHVPAKRGYGWSNSHDYGSPIGTPLYAVSDGTIVESRAIRSGGSSTYPGYPTGYTSYGETVAMRTQSGDIFRWAHLQPGTRISAGQSVKGGTMIGRSGMTGNASGPHAHMDVNGNYDAKGWLASRGIHLKKGAANIKWDNTIANLHKGEAVLTEDLNKKFHQGVENFANGPTNHYTIKVDANGTNVTADDIAEKVIRKIERLESRKPRSRRNG